MNSPFPMANVPPPPPLPGAPAVQQSVFPPQQPPSMAIVDWKAKAMEQIRAKVLVDGKPVTTPQMEVWAYNEILKRMGNVPEVDKRITEGLTSTAVGGVNLGNDVSMDPKLTSEQMQAKIVELVPVRLKWQGKMCVGDSTYIGQVVAYLWNNLPQISSLTDNHQKITALYNWIDALTAPYELDDATRAAANTQPPANPISDQTTAQLAAPPTPPPTLPTEKEEESSGPPLIDPTDGTACKTLRGFKTRVTKTHKTDWKAFCTQHGLDPETGRKVGEAAPQAGSPVAPITPPPPSAPLPALVGQGAPITQPVTIVPTPPVSENTLYDAHGNKTPAYLAAQAAAAAKEPMPVPPVVQPTSPVVFTPTFVPESYVGTPPPGTQPVATTPGLPQNFGTPAPVVIQTPVVVTPAFVPPADPATPVIMSRDEMARMLGGPVTLIVCRLLEVNSVNLQGRVDANQLALLAEKNARAELRISDLAQAQYAVGKQVAQRHFADLLTKHPHCYLLQNGYEFILAAGFLEILIARTVHVYHVSDRGGNIEIKF